MLRDRLDVLDTAVVSKECVLNIRSPLTDLNEVAHKVRVHADELTSKHSSCVDIGGVRLEALVVPQDL